MSRYAFTVRSSVLPPWYSQPTQLSAQGLTAALGGVAVHKLVAYQNGSYGIELQLKRPTHEHALADIATALTSFGIDLLQAEITEVVTDTVAGAILGGTGGAAAGATTENVGAALIVAALGAIIGAAVGSMRETIVARYVAYRSHALAPWTFYRIQQPATNSAPAW